MGAVRRTFAALGAAIALSCALPAASGAQAGPPASVPLAGGWEYLPDPGDRGRALGLPTGEQGDGWTSVKVPHLFETRPVESEFWGTVGWYRLRFTVPKGAPGFGWALRFEQVRRHAQVWLNGRPLGEHKDPYVPFELDAAALRPGEQHLLVVRVDNRKEKEPREGWWNWGGISSP